MRTHLGCPGVPLAVPANFHSQLVAIDLLCAGQDSEPQPCRTCVVSLEGARWLNHGLDVHRIFARNDDKVSRGWRTDVPHGGESFPVHPPKRQFAAPCYLRLATGSGRFDRCQQHLGIVSCRPPSLACVADDDPKIPALPLAAGDLTVLSTRKEGFGREVASVVFQRDLQTRRVEQRLNPSTPNCGNGDSPGSQSLGSVDPGKVGHSPPYSRGS